MTARQGTSAKGFDGAPRFLRYLGMPVFLGLVCLVLYLYVGSIQLDSIEKRILNADFLFSRVVEHIELAVVSTVIVVVLAVGTGILLTRPSTSRVSPLIVGVANIGQAVPSIGLLGTTGVPIADVAARSGFYDQAAFTRTFGRITGETPAQFRRRSSSAGAGAPRSTAR